MLKCVNNVIVITENSDYLIAALLILRRMVCGQRNLGHTADKCAYYRTKENFAFTYL